MCLWTPLTADINPDMYANYTAFVEQLSLKCGEGPAGRVTVTLGKDTPSLLYYQSFTNYNMGYQIQVLDQLPQGVVTPAPLPYDYEEWLDNHNEVKVTRGINGAHNLRDASCSALVLATAAFFLRI